jgi:hypothetical protein
MSKIDQNRRKCQKREIWGSKSKENKSKLGPKMTKNGGFSKSRGKSVKSHQKRSKIAQNWGSKKRKIPKFPRKIRVSCQNWTKKRGPKNPKNGSKNTAFPKKGRVP